MITINRAAILVRPRMPFLKWLRRVDPTSVEVSLEDLQEEPNVYLLPECENKEDAREHLKQICGGIFELQLDEWYRMPSAWPEGRDLDTFERWFEWSFHSMVIDVSDEPLLQEEM